MAVLALDLGGTKLAAAVFSDAGNLIVRESVPLQGRKSTEVGQLISSVVQKFLSQHIISAIGVSVPGISRHRTGTVWAPNIEGWDDYPLLGELRDVAGDARVLIDSDRACSIFGEQWQGSAKGCRDAIFMAVGTGIGAGIVTGGMLVRGASDIAGAIGWMALPKPFESKYIPCGCFEFYASGAGIPKFAREVLGQDSRPSSMRNISPGELTAYHIFEASDAGDAVAQDILRECVAFWGMASANLVSIFNPEKVIFGGGLFGPAAKYVGDIKREAAKWAQPISIREAAFEPSALGGDAAVYGAAFLAIQNQSA